MSRLQPSGPEDATIAIIQVTPFKDDIIACKHNSSDYGRYLMNCMHEAGVEHPRTDIYYDYLMPEYIGTSKAALESWEAQDNISKHSKQLRKNLKNLKNLKIIIALGSEIAQEFGINDPMKSIRGYIFDELKGVAPMIVTYPPRWLFSSDMEQEITFLNDLAKAVRISKSPLGYVRPEENFNVSPTLREVYDFCLDAVQNKRRIYGDIESIGGFDRDKNEITMYGMGRRNDKHVICVPFRVQGGGYYWTNKQEKKIRKWVKKVNKTCPIVAHNGAFDFKHLDYQGLGPCKQGGDTMLLHHALHPELPHSLDYVASIHTDLPYWKFILKKAKHQLDIVDETLRRYNCVDVLATMLIEPILIKENKEQGTYKVYKRFSMPNLECTLKMTNNGMPVDLVAKQKWTDKLKKEQAAYEKTLMTSWDIDPRFNLNSADQKKYLFFGVKPKGFNKNWAKYKEYFKEGTRKNRNTKTFKKLEAGVLSYHKTKPFRNVPGLNIKKTKTNAPSVDDEMRERYHVAINKRLIALKHSKKRMSGHPKEIAELKKMQRFLETYNAYAENEKLLSTYTKFHIEGDGKVHGSFKVNGTKNGRLSSCDPNLQNIPPEAKKMFVAPEGWKFVQADYVNLELVVLAYIANIKALRNVFEQGLNAHDENTKFILGIEKSHPQWDMWRKVIKSFIFGRNYGGGLPGMYRRMLTGIKGLDMTFAELQDIDRKIYEKWPEFGPYTEGVEDEVSRTRMLRNPFGRVRIFLGRPNNIIREGLNFPIQSTAADIMSIGIQRFTKYYDKYKRLGKQFYPCITVHDSLGVLVPDEEAYLVLRLMRKAMKSPIKIGDNSISFDCEVTISQTYKAPEKTEKPIDKVIAMYKKHSDPQEAYEYYRKCVAPKKKAA